MSWRRRACARSSTSLTFAYWWPTEIGWRQPSGAFKRGVSLGRRGESASEVWFGEEFRSRSRSPPVAAGALTSARQPWGSSVAQTATAPPTHELAPLEHAPLPAHCELPCAALKFGSAPALRSRKSESNPGKPASYLIRGPQRLADRTPDPLDVNGPRWPRCARVYGVNALFRHAEDSHHAVWSAP
jgi:hypothetical protein